MLVFFYEFDSIKLFVSGTITMGHPNPGLKHAQNIIRHPGRILPELGRPKPL